MKRLIVINFIGLLLLIGLVVWLILWQQKPAVVYVDSIKLFNACQFKKEMYGRIEQSFGSKMAVMDSLEKKAVSGQLDADQLRQFEIEREALSHDITDAKTETDRVIWERLDQVIKRFGDGKQYGLIIGANGMGTVLYGQPEKDITDIVIKYANQEYEGK